MNIPAIPDYTLEACCGSGAYGDVWTAKDHNGISRAVKILDKGRLERLGVLHREEKAIKLFRSNVPRHPSLVEIYHVGETGDYIYYVMDLADNLGTSEKYIADTLDERLNKGAMAISDAKKLLESMLDAVKCLHKKGLVHRDIKPSNIIYVGGVPRLGDIGLVRSETATMSVAGTIGFMAPDGPLGAQADLYSLGKLLYCVITGRSVDSFPSLPDFPESADFAGIKLMNRVILKACDKDPVNRFRSAGEFRNALHGKIKIRFRTRTVITIIGVVAVSTGVLFFVIDSIMKKSEVSRLMNDVRIKREAGDLLGALADTGSIIGIAPDNTEAKGLRKELINQKNIERGRKISRLVGEARTKGQTGNVLEAIKDTGSILAIDPDNVEAKALRSELIKQKLTENTDTPDKEEHPMTPAERKEFAMLILLYNTLMTKGNFFKALEALDTIEKKWPYMRQNQNIQNFIHKTREKMAEANKAAGAVPAPP